MYLEGTKAELWCKYMYYSKSGVHTKVYSVYVYHRCMMS